MRGLEWKWIGVSVIEVVEKKREEEEERRVVLNGIE